MPEGGAGTAAVGVPFGAGGNNTSEVIPASLAFFASK